MAEGNGASDALGAGDAWADKVRQHHRKGMEWQTWRVPVTDPATPGSELSVIAEAVISGNKRVSKTVSVSGVCVLEALAAHPNTPPRLLAQIVENAPVTVRAFCANPVAPLLLLETPDFPLALAEHGKLALLREETIPFAFLHMIGREAKQSNEYKETRTEAVRSAARLHVHWAAVAGAADTMTEAAAMGWENDVRGYWKATCARASRREREWHTDLVEMGLAPAWAAADAPAPLPLRPCRYPFLDEWFRFPYPEGSPEEAAMLAQIGPDTKNKKELARGLRKNATPADLIVLVQTARNSRGLVMQAVFRHPNANANVVDALATAKNSVPLRDLAQHDRASEPFLRDLLQQSDPNVRRVARRHKNAPPDALEISRRAVMLQTRQDEAFVHLLFVSFVASLHFGSLRSGDALVKKAESLQWTERLEAVLIAGQNPNALSGDFAGRTTDDLLHHLSRDGNRLVRAAAQTCLSDLSYQFVL